MSLLIPYIGWNLGSNHGYILILQINSLLSREVSNKSLKHNSIIIGCWDTLQWIFHPQQVHSPVDIINISYVSMLKIVVRWGLDAAWCELERPPLQRHYSLKAMQEVLHDGLLKIYAEIFSTSWYLAAMHLNSNNCFYMLYYIVHVSCNVIFDYRYLSAIIWDDFDRMPHLCLVNNLHIYGTFKQSLGIEPTEGFSGY